VSDVLDLTQMFGEGWCVTVVDFPAEDVLDIMGVDDAAPLADGVHLASQRLISRPRDVLLLAKPVDTEVTLVLELEGTTGWVGMDTAVLADLSDAGGTACTISKDPNNERVAIARDGAVVGGLEAATGRRWGRLDRHLVTALTSAGFPAGGDDDFSDGLDRLTPSQRAAVALSVVTGVELTLPLLQDPWIGGVSPG
jgi:hypothetical protein